MIEIKNLKKLIKDLKLPKLCKATNINYNRLLRKLNKNIPLSTDESKAIEKYISSVLLEVGIKIIKID